MVSTSSDAVISLPISLSCSTVLVRSLSDVASASAASARSCVSFSRDRCRSRRMTRRRWTRSTPTRPRTSRPRYAPYAHQVRYQGGRTANEYTASRPSWPNRFLARTWKWKEPGGRFVYSLVVSRLHSDHPLSRPSR